MIRNIRTKLTAGLLMLAIGHGYATDNHWRKFDGRTAPSSLPMTVQPKDFKIFTLDQQKMLAFLSNLSTDYDQGQTILLPTPDNKYRAFRVWKTPMLEDALAAQHPEIQTFTAVAEDDQNVTAKLDYTLYGFRALVLDGNNSFIVDPYSDAADGYYISFYRNDFITQSQYHPCEVGMHPDVQPSDNATQTVLGNGRSDLARSHGTLRRQYRLAISCTGEYALAAVGPGASKAQTLNKIVSTINRVNGVYESEISVTMKIIAANSDIIYVNPATDPYNCNTNLSCLINEVQTNVTAVIGDQNYDIGHIVCTAGGGLAQLRAACAGGKARGTSTSAGPDDFSTLLHEMGHQLGANHTFSANTGGCNGNGNEGTAYEAGAGISIMSYAGLCDPNNVGAGQNFFHVNSLDEITTYLGGTGGTCGTTSAGTVAVALPALVDTYFIPRNTPFELTGPKATSTQPAAAITYSWEQYDLGNFGGTEANSGAATAGPIVKVYTPDTSRSRSYPEYDRITSGAYGTGTASAGQRLPNAARQLHFKLVARSKYQGWGTFNFSDNDMVLKADNGSADFRVTSQATAETWQPCTQKRVEWAVANTDQDSVKCKWVNIYLSRDDGKTFPYLLVANAPNNGAYNVTVPNVYTTKGRIKVKGSGNVFFDINKGQLMINGDPTGVKDLDLGNALSIYPNPASNRIHISSKETSGATLRVILYNVVGQRMWSGDLQKETDIPVAGFARGNYLLQVINTNTGAKSTHKVALQ